MTPVISSRRARPLASSSTASSTRSEPPVRATTPSAGASACGSCLLDRLNKEAEAGGKAKQADQKQASKVRRLKVRQEHAFIGAPGRLASVS